MIKQLGLVPLQKAVQDRITAGTGVKCYDAVPKGASAPLYLAQAIGKRCENTKTMVCEVFTLYVHAIAKAGRSSAGVYDMIQAAEEAMTENISLPPGYDVVWQREAALISIQTDETNEKHAVIAYEIKVCYGFMTKN